MDQNSFFQNPVDFDFFSSLRMPPTLPFPDPFDMFNRRKDSLLSIGSPRLRLQSFHDLTVPSNMDMFAPKTEDLHLDANTVHKNDALLKDLQSMPVSGASDAQLDPFFNRDFTFNPYQICRSRAGSINFARFRRDSEDLFHSNSDLFKQFCSSITDTRNSFENAFQSIVNFPKFPQFNEKLAQNPQIQASMDLPSSFANDVHGLNFNENTTTSTPNMPALGSKLEQVQRENVVKELAVTTKTTATTFDAETIHEDSDDEDQEPQGKKVFLNNGSEVKTEQQKKKVGRPKKLDIKKVKTNGSTIIKIETKAKKLLAPQESAASVKIETAPVQQASQQGAPQSKVNPITEIGQLKVPDNLKQIIEGSNIPKDVQDFFKNSYSNLFDTKKIGTLTPAERKAKVDRYLEKRRKRTYSRKVNYDCRKRVADNRLRIKGRFVTRVQAFGLLEEAGIPFDAEKITNPEIKALLTEKAGAGATNLKKRAFKEQRSDTNQGINDKEEAEYDEEEEDDDEDLE